MKKGLAIASLIGISALLTGCGNYDMWDTQYTFDYAICKFEGIPERIDITSWRDFEDGEQIQIKSKDGKIYLVSSNYCVLVDE